MKTEISVVNPDKLAQVALKYEGALKALEMVRAFQSKHGSRSLTVEVVESFYLQALDAFGEIVGKLEEANR